MILRTLGTKLTVPLFAETQFCISDFTTYSLPSKEFSFKRFLGYLKMEMTEMTSVSLETGVPLPSKIMIVWPQLGTEQKVSGCCPATGQDGLENSSLPM